MIRGALRAVTTRQSFSDVLEIFSDADDTPFNTAGSKVQIAISRQYPGDWPWNDDYGFSSGTGNNPAPLLTLSTADGSLVTSFETIGKYPFTFTPAQMATLQPGQYVVGANIERNGFVAQLVLGDLPVLDGVVPQ